MNKKLFRFYNPSLQRDIGQCVLGFAYLEHFGATDRTSPLRGGTSILHSYGLGTLNLSRSSTFDTITIHNDSSNSGIFPLFIPEITLFS